MIIIDSEHREVCHQGQNRRALFLDRDGVINVDHGYVSRVEDFEWIDGIFDLCRSANARGDAIVIVTNQGGIGLGLYTEEAFRQLSRWMLDELAKRNIRIARVIGCPHHPRAIREAYKVPCICRKPEPGMIMRGVSDFAIDASASALIGDNRSDIEAAKRANIGRRIWLANSQEQALKLHDADTVATLQEARELLFGQSQE